MVEKRKKQRKLNVTTTETINHQFNIQSWQARIPSLDD